MQARQPLRLVQFPNWEISNPPYTFSFAPSSRSSFRKEWKEYISAENFKMRDIENGGDTFT